MSAHPAPDVRAVSFNAQWVTRLLVGVPLALIAMMVVAFAPEVFACLLAVVCILAAREWHRCVGGGARTTLLTAITGASIALSEILFFFYGSFWIALVPVALGMAAAFVAGLRQNPLWQALGVPYLAIPVLALLCLRTPNGALIVIGLFLIVWATDTGALVCGKLIGGPKLAPRLSPGKTWAGTIGGSVIAGLVYAAYVAAFANGPVLAAASFGFALSFAAHGGDLLESFVKRRFGVKDTGSVLPGHGGMLDRIDSTLAAAPVLALLVFVAHINPLFGTLG